MPEELATEAIREDARLAAVIRPFLGGEEVNQSPRSEAARWIVDFSGIADDKIPNYGRAYRWVAERVRPARQRLKNKPRLQLRWWAYEAPALDMRRAIAGLEEVLVIALVSKTVMPVRARTGQVFSHKLGVIATDSFAELAILSSSMHQLWAVKYGSTMRNDVNYSPSDVFLTFPRPGRIEPLHEIGKVLDAERREIMLRREIGLTKLYNLVNDPDIADSADKDVARLRQIHVELDKAVMAAYGWEGVLLDHGFHTYRRMTRWTIGPYARVEVFDRLLEENHKRAASQGEAPPTADENEIGEGE
jgi:hypothetical protein